MTHQLTLGKVVLRIMVKKFIQDVVKLAQEDVRAETVVSHAHIIALNHRGVLVMGEKY